MSDGDSSSNTVTVSTWFSFTLSSCTTSVSMLSLGAADISIRWAISGPSISGTNSPSSIRISIRTREKGSVKASGEIRPRAGVVEHQLHL